MSIFSSPENSHHITSQATLHGYPLCGVICSHRQDRMCNNAFAICYTELIGVNLAQLKMCIFHSWTSIPHSASWKQCYLTCILKHNWHHYHPATAMRDLVDLKNLSWLPSNATATRLACLLLSERVMIMGRTRMTIFKFQQNLEAFAKINLK